MFFYISVFALWLISLPRIADSGEPGAAVVRGGTDWRQGQRGQALAKAGKAVEGSASPVSTHSCSYNASNQCIAHEFSVRAVNGNVNERRASTLRGESQRIKIEIEMKIKIKMEIESGAHSARLVSYGLTWRIRVLLSPPAHTQRETEALLLQLQQHIDTRMWSVRIALALLLRLLLHTGDRIPFPFPFPFPCL